MKRKIKEYKELLTLYTALLRSTLLNREDKKAIRNSYKRIKDELDRLNEELDTIQKTCNHTFRYDGHGHNDDMYVCTKCDKLEWR
jgi:hypothetical protein